YLAISDCPSLADIGALGRLRHVGSQLRLATLPSLTSLDGLEALEECPAVYLYDVPGVASLQPLAPINLSVLDLENTGIPNLGSVPPAVVPFELQLNGNTNLTSLAGLPGSCAISELYLSGEPALTSLAGLEGIPITGSLSIHSCPLLTSMEGLGGVQALDGLLYLSNNDALVSLAGLEGLESVGGLFVTRNPALCDTLVDAFVANVNVAGATDTEGNADCSP
ncbi:hypothetical protein KDL67_12765, partial [bacterium]|nr:hypothetical protein [bacterium]